MRHLKTHERNKTLAPFASVKEASEAASSISKAGLRTLRFEDVLESFPECTDDFITRLALLLRNNGVIIVDNSEIETPVPRQPVAEEESADDPEEKGNLSCMPEMKETLVEKLFYESCVNPNAEPRAMFKQKRAARGYTLHLRRYLGYARQTNHAQEWQLLVDKTNTSSFPKALEDRGVKKCTVLCHIKTMERVLRQLPKWTSRPDVPSTPEFTTGISECHTLWKHHINAFSKLVAQEKLEAKTEFVAKGMPQIEDIRNYFESANNKKQVEDALNWCEDYARKHGNTIPLGDGHHYDRHLAVRWNTIVRRCCTKMSVGTKRTSAIQGMTIAEFRDRKKVVGGFQITINDHKNGHLNADSFVLEESEEKLWMRFYNLRKMCVKKGEWMDREQFFINVSGTMVKNFHVAINKAMPQQPHSITGRTMRKATATVGSALSPSKKQKLIPYLNHSADTHAREYVCLTKEQSKQGADAVKAVQDAQLVRQRILNPEAMEKLCSFTPTAVFPEKALCEDMLIEIFKMDIASLDSNVYDEIHQYWKAQMMPKMVKAIVDDIGDSFNAMEVLGKLRDHEEWRDVRLKLRTLAEEAYAKRKVKILENLIKTLLKMVL